MKLKKLLGSFVWILLAATLILINISVANADEGVAYSEPSVASSADE